MVSLAREQGLSSVVVPAINAGEAALIGGLPSHPRPVSLPSATRPSDPRSSLAGNERPMPAEAPTIPSGSPGRRLPCPRAVEPSADQPLPLFLFVEALDNKLLQQGLVALALHSG